MFKNLGLCEEIISAVQKIGFVEPTPIQKKAIPSIITGKKDMVGLAQTGTGKTAAFGLPMIQLIDFNSTQTQGIVICPTRELCIQISGDFDSYCHFIKKAKIVSVYGGASITNQIRQIKKGAQIIIATPGRLLDLIKRKVVKLSNVGYVVLDEADEMLNMGFKDELDGILDKTPKDKRTWLFSATMPGEVARIARNYMNNPVEITVGKKNSSASNIKHVNYIIREKDRYQALKRIIDYYPEIFGLIFCRTRRDTQQIAEKLMKDGYNAEALHGDLSQSQRDYVMRRFREKSLQVLVATDVAARGLDVNDITHVINYNLPDESEGYTHRCGRTARAGKSGISIALTNLREKRKLSEVERKAGIKFEYAKVPDGYAICENQLYAMVEKLVNVEVKHEEIGKFLDPVYNTLAELTKEELIQRFVSIEFNRFLNYYKNSNDINATVRKKEPAPMVRKQERKRSSGKKIQLNDGETKRFFINVGKLDNINAGAIIRLVCEKSHISAGEIGKIEILREFSFFNVAENVEKQVSKSLKGAKLDGRSVIVQLADKEKATIDDKPKFSKKFKSKAKRKKR
ncbi:MAG: DEAD/DEAH box helicase [Desulfobacterales bacterium]|nr:DEAD/DEAH box helicase [Desulfobacterales bacterium]